MRLPSPKQNNSQFIFIQLFVLSSSDQFRFLDSEREPYISFGNSFYHGISAYLGVEVCIAKNPWGVDSCFEKWSRAFYHCWIQGEKPSWLSTCTRCRWKLHTSRRWGSYWCFWAFILAFCITFSTILVSLAFSFFPLKWAVLSLSLSHKPWISPLYLHSSC